MNSYDQTSMKYPDSSKSTKNKDDLHDEATTAEASRLLSTDQTRKSSNRGPESSDQSSVSKTPGQGDSESEKGSPGAPQTSSNQAKPKASQLSQPPELLLIKLQEKANIQFPEDRKRDVSSNAASQLNSIATLLEGGDLKSKSKLSYNTPITYGFSNPLINANNPELLYSMYLQSQYTNFLPINNIPFPNITDKSIPQLFAQSHEKLLSGREQTIQSMLQSQNHNSNGAGLNHTNEDNDKDHVDAGKVQEQEDKGLNAGRLASVQSSESKTNLSKDNANQLNEDSLLDMSKISKGLSAKKKKVRQCFNKLCNADPNDLNLWSKQKIQGMLICKPCHEAFKKEQFCCYCQQIYLDQEGYSNDDKDWIECESCKHWVHIECEQEKGLKNVRYLLDKEKNYKFYCPSCRTDKNKILPTQKPTRPLKASTRNSYGRLQNGTSNPYQRQFPPQRRQSQKVQAHPKPALDDKLSQDEMMEEPVVKKVKIVENPVEVIDIPIAEGIKEAPVISLKVPDLAKLKLDSMFNRNSKKKYVRPVTTTFDNYNDIDKLMNQYAGKKVQLTELEINYDLIRIKELTCSYGYMDRSVLDLNYGDQSDSDNVEEKGVSGKSKRVRFTEQRKSTKGRGKNFYNEADMFYDEDTSESMEGQSAGPVRKNMKHKNQKYDY